MTAIHHFVAGIAVAAALASSAFGQGTVEVGQRWCAVQPFRYVYVITKPTVTRRLAGAALAPNGVVGYGLLLVETGTEIFRVVRELIFRDGHVEGESRDAKTEDVLSEIAEGYLVPCGVVPIS